MNIYITIWLALLVSSIVWKKSILLIVLFGFSFIIIEGGRDIDVGVDTSNYCDIFNGAGGGNYLVWVEPMWNLVCFFFYNIISSNYTIFLFFIATVTLCNFFYVSYKESPSPLLSIFIFVSLHMYMASFNIMRQYFSMSFLFLSWHFQVQNKKSKSLLTLVIALLSHYSNIFALVIYYWNRIPLTKANILFFLLGSFVFGSLMNENLLSLFTISIFENFLEKDTVFRDSSFVVILMVIAQNIITTYIVNNLKAELFGNFWFKLFILSSIVFNATYMVAYAARLYSIFALSQLIFIPVFLQQIRIRKRGLVYFVFLLYMSAQFFRILLANGNGIVPYKSVLM